MREISREEHEMILNLFIMAFMDYPINEMEYVYRLNNTYSFPKIKSCFPMDEVCEEVREVSITPNSTANAGYIYLPANYIKEV